MAFELRPVTAPGRWLPVNYELEPTPSGIACRTSLGHDP